MAFLSIPIAQMQTGALAGANCGPSMIQELGLISSVDAVNIPARRIREASGDDEGGIEGSLLVRTWNDLTDGKYPFLSLRFDTRSEMNDLLEHTSIGLIIDTRITLRTKWATNDFAGLHWWTVAGGTLRDGTYKCEDPGTTHAGWMRVPRDVIFDAAEAVNGHGLFWVVNGVRTHDVDRAAVRDGVRVFARPDRTSRVVKRLDEGESVHVRRTRKGGPFRREDGTIGHGWYEIGAGFVPGRGLR